MAESKEEEKAPLPGKKKSSRRWLRRGRGTQRVDFSQMKDLAGREPGIYYRVCSTTEPMVFRKKRDALAFKALLKTSQPDMPVDIVREEITPEGFEL